MFESCSPIQSQLTTLINQRITGNSHSKPVSANILLRFEYCPPMLRINVFDKFSTDADKSTYHSKFPNGLGLTKRERAIFEEVNVY